MNEEFRKACEEAGIPYEEFPFDFQDTSPVDFPSLTAALLWIQKKSIEKLFKDMASG